MNSGRRSVEIWPVAVRNFMPASHSSGCQIDLAGERVHVLDQ